MLHAWSVRPFTLTSTVPNTLLISTSLCAFSYQENHNTPHQSLISTPISLSLFPSQEA